MPKQILLPVTILTNPLRATKTPERCAEDARLLEQGLLEEPGNTRYMFYLANSYKDCGQKEKAIDAYKRCFEAGGWDEERFICLLRIAQLSEGLTTFNNVVDAYKAAQDYRPQRAGETMRNLARFCKWWADGTAFPEGERLFIDESCYLPRQPKVKPMKVLVVIPTQSTRPEMLKEAIASAFNQTQVPEVVLAGGPGLLSERLNAVISASDCDAFVMLSDDDLLEPDFIEKTAARMESTGAGIVHTKYTHFGDESCVTGNSNHISVTSLCRKSVWADAKGYKDVSCFDYAFWMACLGAGATTSFIDEPLWKYRIHKGQAGMNVDI